MPIRTPSRAAVGLGLFAAGTAFGLVAGPSAAAGAALLAGGMAWVRAWRRAALPMLVVVIGAGHGTAARWRDARTCRALLPEGRVSLVVRLAEPLGNGRLAEARVEGGCRGDLTLRGTGSQRYSAGDVLQVTGTWRAGHSPIGPAGGTVRVEQASVLRRTPSVAEQIRNRVEAAADRLYGPRSGLVEALVIGRRGGIDRGLTDAFSRTGLVHLLSISGFHVGLIWGWLLLACRAAGAGRAAGPAAAVGIVLYVALLGMPPPAVRAAGLALLSAACRARQRQPATGTLFAAVATGVVALDPWAITSLGAWFSVAALWGATAAVRWSDRALGPRPIWRMLSGSTGATLAAAPLTAGFFGTVPVAGILLNVVAVPVAALAVPAVVASLLLDRVAGRVAEAFAAGGGTLLAALEGIARLGAAVPGASIQFPAGPVAGAVAGAVLAGVVWIFGTRHTLSESVGRLAAVAAAAAAVHAVVLLPRPAHTGTRLALHFLSVGQGDAALLETPQGHWFLIDAGPANDRWDAGRAVIVPFLRRRGVSRLDGVLLSHGHLDHYGGLGAVIDGVTVTRLLDPAAPTGEPGYLRLLDRLADRGVEWLPIRAGARFELDGVTIRVVHPDAGWAGFGESLNEDSAVIVITAGPFSAVFPGDAGFPAESVAAGRIGRADLLKVGHHGSRTATGLPWLAALEPAAAIVSSGVNRYGHPSPETLGRLRSAGVRVYRTDEDGTVTVAVDDSTMRIVTRRGSTTFSLE